ncbi:MAG TPA: hypothetical protein VIZ90_01540 [Rhizobiaceae bacterium]
MTVSIVLLYMAIGVGCGLIRLSAVAVGLMAVVPALVGAYVARSDGPLSALGAALIALLVIECAYFITMLVIARPWNTKPTGRATDARVSGDLGFPRKPQIGEEP